MTCYAIIALLIVSRLMVKFFMVTEETILVIRDVGVQVKTVYLGGRSSSRFIDRSKISDIIINEAITMLHIRVYMAIIVEGEDKMVVVFQLHFPHMSQPVHKKKFGSEFLCKTRYRNTLPLPPFAPKLLALPSSTERCIKFQSTGLNESTANEMILDNQLAIPIDLIEMRENYFGEGRQHHHENGSLANGTLNQIDEMLLTVPLKAASGIPAANGVIAGGSSAGLVVPNKHRLPVVSWLRRTEYISSETPTGAGKGAYKENNVGKKKNMVIDNSREGQIAAIEKTFERFSKVSEEKFLAGLRHPTKPGLTAVESLPVFPDFSIWGNDYTLVTFDVDPEMTNDRSSRSQDEGNRAQRSSNALIKPMHNANDPETWLAYYLPDMDTAKEINHRKRSRAQLAASGLNADDDDEDSKEISFSLQRDYTYTTIPCASLSQLVFTFRDDAETKQKAAFYNPMQSKLMLRKKRAKRYEDDDPPITHIDVTGRRMNSDELAAKRDALEAIGL
ncbi:RNA polymerase-associated factor [Entomortierella chlamydospora]|uniref:RNA polymerase-associated factor n=1 Tax=Entomortierella chlamydospora TaxID=101097 RepID=A0A9P6MTB4_9FUNG|nr:RNA polymerase-associated factor [Entomortierella chlamydospora]